MFLVGLVVVTLTVVLFRKFLPVYEGMPVITDKGLVGQVMNVNYSYSRVLLLTDPSCSIPVIDSRSFVRAISAGTSAHGEVVVVNDKFGIRLTDVISQVERIKKLQ